MGYKSRQMSDTEYYRRDLSKRVSRLEKIVKALDGKINRRIGQRVICTCQMCIMEMARLAREESRAPPTEGTSGNLVSSVTGGSE